LRNRACQQAKRKGKKVKKEGHIYTLHALDFHEMFRDATCTAGSAAVDCSAHEFCVDLKSISCVSIVSAFSQRAFIEAWRSLLVRLSWSRRRSTTEEESS
jgi:hypothetical protein